MTPARRFCDVLLYGTNVNQIYAFAIKTSPMDEPQSLTSLRYRVGSTGKVLLINRQVTPQSGRRALTTRGPTLKPRRDPATQNRPNIRTATPKLRPHAKHVGLVNLLLIDDRTALSSRRCVVILKLLYTGASGNRGHLEKDAKDTEIEIEDVKSHV